MRPWTADLVDAVSTACRLGNGAGTGDARRVVNNTGRRVGDDAGVLARLSLQQLDLKLDTQTTTKKHLTALCSGLPGSAGTRKVELIWTLLKQETVSGSGISWAICKSAPRSSR